MIILNMNLFALFYKLYYVTKIHIILDLLFYNYLYSYKFTILQLYGNLTIFTVYILLTVVIMVRQLIYNFTNLRILIK